MFASKLAENAAQYLAKGSHVTVVGRVQNNDYERDGAAAVVQEWRLDVQRAVAPGEHYGPPLGEV